jgi:hypothetical protein
MFERNRNPEDGLWVHVDFFLVFFVFSMSPPTKHTLPSGDTLVNFDQGNQDKNQQNHGRYRRRQNPTGDWTSFSYNSNIIQNRSQNVL